MLFLVEINDLFINDLEAELCRRSFATFVKKAWALVDPAPLVWGFHLDGICAVLQAIAEGRLQRAIINIPPGHAKSMLVSVLWPAWRWTRTPSWKVMTASHKIDLATRDAVKARTLINTKWYQDRFAKGKWEFQADQNNKTSYANTAMGARSALSVTGGATGFRGSALIIDDPHDAAEAHSKLARDTVIRWKTETMSSRFDDLETAEEVLIMQRLHDEDLTGYLLKNEPGRWAHLCLPSEFEAGRPSAIEGVWTDPRTEAGELLFPDKFPESVLKDIKVAMGSYGFAGQHQQRPVPAEGGLMKREWFNHLYRPEDVKWKWDEQLMAVDCTFKKTEDSDYVAIGVWGRKGRKAYLIDLFWERAGFVETCDAIRRLKGKHPDVYRVLIEDKANGSAVIEVLKQSISGIVPVLPDGGKESRIAATTPFWEAGDVWLPADMPKLRDFIDEACAFPKAAHDDALDMAAYALTRLLVRSRLALLEAAVKDM